MLKPNNVVKGVETSASVVSLDEIRTHLGIFGDTQFDTLLTELRDAAEVYVGDYIGQPLGSLDIIAYYSRFDTYLESPYDAVETISSVAYFDDNQMTNAIDSTSYFFDTTSKQKRAVFTTIPEVTLSQYHESPVVVTFTSNYLDDNLLLPIRQAVLLIVGDWYKYRENTTEDTQNRIPVAAHTLLDSYKRNQI